MMPVAVLRTGEISLKGGNRHLFEKQLALNVKKTLKNNNISFLSTQRLKGRLLVYFKGIEDLEPAKKLFGFVFGVCTFSTGLLVGKDIQEVLEAVDMFKDRDFKSFRVTAKRQDKRFAMNSMELEREVGRHIQQKYDKKVDLRNFDAEFLLEVCEEGIILSMDKFSGAGGLPVGSCGQVAVLTGYENFELCAFYMMKRGCEVTFLGPPKKTEFVHKFNCFREPDFLDAESGNFLGTMDEKNILAIVAGCGPENLGEIKEAYPEKLVLAPLVGFAEHEISSQDRNLAKNI